jgi:GNAT superfamily N-acetyltransferase
MAIRHVSPEDAAAIVALTTPLNPIVFDTAESFRAMLERPAPQSTERLVAEEEGAIVAWAPSGLHGDGSGWFWIGVDPARRGRGIGTELYERIEARLRGLHATPLRTTIDDEDGRRFVERRGFERTNVQRLQALDLQEATLPDPPESVPFSTVDPWSLFELYRDAYADIPSHTPRPAIDEERYRRDVVDSTTLDRAVSSVILEDGAPVAFTLVVANRESGRAGADMTAVRSDRRGLGLAHAVKVASLHRARATGLRTMLTANDLENAPMLAVNRKLGFEPTIVLENYEKTP